MKLLRYGPAGHEKPGVLDAQGRVRDLSGHLPDLASKWTGAICGPDDDVQTPRGSVKTDWEVELGVVIGKGCDTFGPMSPWLVTPDEVPNPQALSLWLELDGKRAQDGNTVQGLGVQTQRAVQA